MKKILALLFFACAMPFFAGVANNPLRIAIKDGLVIPLESGRPLHELNLSSKNPDWEKFENYENKLAHVFEKLEGVSVMSIRNASHGSGDTAWLVLSRELSLKSRPKRLLLEISSKATVNVKLPNNSTYWCNQVIWFNSEKKQIGTSDFAYQASSEGYILTQIPLAVPPDAVSLKIQLGADNPNIGGKQYLAFKSIQIREADAHENHTGDSSFISQYFESTAGSISWDGDFPDNSYGTLQLSWAPEIHGAPGRWSAFIGPDGTSKSSYTNHAEIRNIPAEARWLRYRFTFHSRKAAPCLRTVRVGDFRDFEWNTFFCKTAPLVVNTTTPARDFMKTISAKIIPTSLINWKTLKMTLDGKDITADAVIEGNTVSYMPKTPFADSLHTFAIDIADIDGNRTVAKRYFDFQPLPESNIVTLRDDGFILIDGAPFFPLGLFSMAKKPWNDYSFDKGVQALKDAGFNTTHNYNSTRDGTFSEFMAAAKKYGLRVFIAGPAGANSHDLSPILNTIRKEKGNSTILTWYLADDASAFWGPDELAEFSDAVRATDPSRPTAQADGASSYDNFANSTNIFLPEIYPVMDDDAESNEKCVSKVIRAMKHSFERIALEGHPNISVWATLQYFQGWGNKRYPTPAELRAMSYASIIQGAHGIIYYTYAPGDHVKNHGAASTPEAWSVMSALSKELSSLLPVLCERKAESQPAITILEGPAQDALNFPSVSGLLKIHNGKSYWIAVNSAFKPVTASFAMPGLQGGQVLFENRAVTIQNGILTDTFEPYAVHVYELQ